MTSAFLEAPVLRGDHVVLEPLAPEHEAELAEAVQEGEQWRLWVTRIPSPQEMAAEIRRRLTEHEAGTMVPWTVRDARTGRAVGMTTYMNVRPDNRRLEIGSTWNARSAQRTGTNAESKLLLLSHAFETLDCIAVEFRTHWFNHASRAAIARLGAKQDGVLRNHAVTDDGIKRDTVVFSVIDSEWPTVRHHLRFQLDKSR